MRALRLLEFAYVIPLLSQFASELDSVHAFIKGGVILENAACQRLIVAIIRIPGEPCVDT